VLSNARNVSDLTAIEPLQDVYMESTEDGSGVLISWSVLDEELYDNFTVLYCVGAHQCNVCFRLLIALLLTVSTDLLIEYSSV